MGKKGKSKNTAVISTPETASKVEPSVEPLIEVKEVSNAVKVEVKVEPAAVVLDVADDASGTLKSKKKNRNNKDKSENKSNLFRTFF